MSVATSGMVVPSTAGWAVALGRFRAGVFLSSTFCCCCGCSSGTLHVGGASSNRAKVAKSTWW